MKITYYVHGYDANGGYMGKTFDTIEEARRWVGICHKAIIYKREGVLITDEIVK